MRGYTSATGMEKYILQLTAVVTGAVVLMGPEFSDRRDATQRASLAKIMSLFRNDGGTPEMPLQLRQMPLFPAVFQGDIVRPLLQSGVISVCVLDRNET